MATQTSVAASENLANAINNVRNNCMGISEELNQIKTRAGINTAITAVGTGTATGALIVGIKKDSIDDELEKWMLDAINEQNGGIVENQEKDKKIEALKNVAIEKSNKLNKSKKLGNIRTGLMATSTATNIAGAVISSKNQVKDDLANMITKCIKSVSELYDTKMQAYLDKSADETEIQYAENIINACSGIKSMNLSGINKKAKGAMVLSAIGAGTGMAGTITSGIANSDKIRSDASEEGKNKEHTLNTTSNILAGATGAVSLGATIFNATEIGAIKTASAIADKCAEVLK